MFRQRWSLLVLVAVLPLLLPATAAPTVWQQQLFNNVASKAEMFAEMARPTLLRRFDEPGIREVLHHCCRHLADAPAATLLRRVREEMSVTELISGFVARAPGTRFGPPFLFGPSLPEVQQLPYFPNLWEVWLMGILNASHPKPGSQVGLNIDDIETKLYGLKPFSQPSSPKNIPEAQERAAYTMVNVQRQNAGSEIFGDVSVVLSSKAAASTAVVHGFDTGSWGLLCNSTQHFNLSYPVSCDAFRGQDGLGTIAHFEHLLLSNDRYWQNLTSGDDAGAGASALAMASEPASERASEQASERSRVVGAGVSPLGSKLRRLLAPLAPSLPPMHGAELVQYLEALPATTLAFPADVKLVLGSFPSLFGTGDGVALQRWCARNGWLLAWTLGYNLGNSTALPLFWNAGHVSDRTWEAETYGRLLDPNTAAVANASVSAADRGMFKRAWAAAARARGRATTAVGYFNASEWQQRWASLVAGYGDALRFAPLRYGVCADTDRCVGIAADQTCVCYQLVRLT